MNHYEFISFLSIHFICSFTELHKTIITIFYNFGYYYEMKHNKYIYKMKNLLKLSLLLLILLPLVSAGQVYKLKSTDCSFRSKLDDDSWSKWEEPTDTNVLITVDFNKDRITIYSKETQVYDIVEYEGKTTDDEGDDSHSYYCVDNAGNTCRVKTLKINSQVGRLQMYVYYADMNWLYNIYLLD